ncbi:nickel-dependent lactate racemase [candidate division KSB1 bacterium]|nr:nickel-dependent lactate racemase [candidate division KSB1 bacterium]RQW05660.1 MAG: nickel-dependent lactate racemase [candidate division KSB1 bacterium]
MKLKYGDSFVHFVAPEAIEWHVVQKNVPFSFAPQAENIQGGINKLATQLTDRINKRAHILFIVPDHTRKCNLSSILPPLIEHLENKFLADIKILVANGSHAQQSEATVREIISPDIYDQIPTIQHDALANDRLTFLGKTSYGTLVVLNKMVKEADFIITINAIMYHYFAGFGGGAKMLLPGVAAYETIRQNHSLTITKDGRFHPHAQNGNMETNPVYLDVSQVVDFVPNALSLQVVLSKDGEIVGCKAGPILETQKKLVPLVEKLYTCTLPERADIVIASAGGCPSDINLIQAHKSIHHAYQAVQKNGTLVVLAECREGVGSKTFLPYFEYGTTREIGQALLNDYRINGQTALALKEKTEKTKIYFISSLASDIVKKIGMIPCKTIEDAFSRIEIGQHAKGLIVPEAQITLPVITN